MKKSLIGVCVIAAGCGMISCSHEQKPNEIKVLYLGGQSEWSNGEYGGDKPYTEEEFAKLVQDRMDGFGAMLREYFDSVTVMRAADWTPEISAAYDVTIFDGVPPKLEDRRTEEDEYGPRYISPRYLPDDYEYATITIGSIGEYIGRRLGIKNDWYCLCLDADAHGMNLDHQIFKGPFTTDITLEKQPTPENAFHYQYFFDEPLPDSVMMWRVNTKGYITDEGFKPGMVSRPWGYADSPDSEVISSGVCAKTIDAVALGRHGNFFTWGFIGGPQYMTPEAQKVFANAVVYMAGHKGAPITRKMDDRRAFRDYTKELAYLIKRSSYEARCKSDSAFYAERRALRAAALEKKAKGEKLTEKESIYAAEDDLPPYVAPTYESYLKRYAKELYDEYGNDESKYLEMLQGEYDYIYGLPAFYRIEVDQDAKAWGIPNNDIRLIEKAVECLEKGEEVDRANRVLERYTLCEFTEPAQWRNWLDTYHEKIFFTESGGWLFMVNEPGAPGNDYKAIERRRQAKKDALAAEEAAANAPLDATNPVGCTATAKNIGNDKWEVRISMKILPGYHVYDKVAASDAYKALGISFTLPGGCELVGEVKKQPAKPFGTTGTTVYEDDTEFVQIVKSVSKPETLTCEISYQCCDAHTCLVPTAKKCKPKFV